MLACLAESAKIVDNLLHIAECFQVLSLQCGGRWWCLYQHNSHLARDSVVTGDTGQQCAAAPLLTTCGSQLTSLSFHLPLALSPGHRCNLL